MSEAEVKTKEASIEKTDDTSTESTLYYFYSVGCGWCKRTEPLVDKLNDEGYNILKLDLADSDNAAIQQELKTKYKKQCGTPWLIDAETGFDICGFREEDIIKKWAEGEEIPAPPRPNGPPPPPPQDYDNEEQVENWKSGYEKWVEENKHVPNLPPVDTMLERLKQQQTRMAQQGGQPGQPGAPSVPHQTNINTNWYYIVEGTRKVEVHADANFIQSLQHQYYVRGTDGRLTKVVGDPSYDQRIAAQQPAPPKQPPAPEEAKSKESKKPSKTKKSTKKKTTKK